MTRLDWPAAVPTLTDGSVMLRGWTNQDADAVYAACQDPEIQRWMDVPVPYLLEHAIQFVAEQSAEQWSSQKGAPFAITSPTALLAAIIAAASERRYARLVLSPSAPAVGFYKRAGFILPDDDAGEDRLLVRPLG